MRRWLLSILLFACALSSAAAQADQHKTFMVAHELGYSPVEPALRAYASANSVSTDPQHLCVIGYRLEPAQKAQTERIAWVYWAEGQRLILWNAAAEGVDSKETLMHSVRDLDLRKDVVKRERDVGSSTYRIDQQWLRRLLADCRQRGQRFVLTGVK